MVRRRTAAVLAGALIAAAGCSSGGGSGETPEGFVRGTAAVLSVAYPKGWQSGPDASLPLSVQAPGQAAFLSVIKDVAERADPDMIEATMGLGPMMQAAGYRRTASKAIEVAGATAARRVDYTFTDFRGTGAPGQGIDVGVIGGNGHLHVVRVTWRRGRLKDATADGIVDSIKVG